MIRLFLPTDVATLLLLSGGLSLLALTLFLALAYSPIFLGIGAWAGLRATLEVHEARALRLR